MLSTEKLATLLSLVVVTVVLLTGCSGEDAAVSAPEESAERPAVAGSSLVNSSKKYFNIPSIFFLAIPVDSV